MKVTTGNLLSNEGRAETARQPHERTCKTATRPRRVASVKRPTTTNRRTIFSWGKEGGLRGDFVRDEYSQRT